MWVRPTRPVEYPHSERIASRLRSLASEFGWPCFGHNAELKSLVYHCSRREGLRTDSPGRVERTLILERLMVEYAAGRWSIPDDFMTRAHFERVVSGIDMTSSPGYPHCQYYSTNAEMFGFKHGVIPEVKLEEIWATVKMQIKMRKSDPIRLFIKPEAHKQEKLRGYRYRLISSVSVIDQIIDAMLFGSMNKEILSKPLQQPCKGGWSPYVGGWKIAPREGVMSLDKSAWDWSVCGWIVDMELELRLRLCDNPTAEWKDLAVWRYRELYESPVFVTSGGLKLKQLEPGVMKSGCYNTLVSNSIMQSIVHHRACYEVDLDPGWMWTLGDDTIQSAYYAEDRDKYVAALAQYCHVKHVVDGVEFAGMRFEEGFVTPLYASKHAFQLLHMSPKIAEEMVDAYALLYHRAISSRSMKALLSTVHRVRSDAYLDIIWDGLE